MKLNCDDFVPFIDAFIDGEFDGLERAEAQAHIDHCPSCRQKVEFHIQFKHDIRQALNSPDNPPKAPESLRNNILTMLEQEHQKQLRATTEQPFKRAGLMMAPAAAVMLASALILPAFTIAPAAAKKHNDITKQTIEWHKGNLPLEVKSQDAKKVAKWFTGKVNFPVRLPKFAGKNTKIVGARLAHIQDRRAAYVLYDIDGTRMSVMMFDGKDLKVPSAKVSKLAGRDVALLNDNGYEVAVMQNHGVTYTLASELSKDSFIKVMEASLR